MRSGAPVFRTCVFALAAMLFASGQVGADTVTLTASADNTMYQGSNSRSNGVGDHFFAGRTEEDRLRRALLRFDLSPVPAGSTVTAATLTLHMSRTRAGVVDVSLHEVLALWGEGSSNASEEEGEGGQARPGDTTWSHRVYDSITWNVPGGEFSASPSATVSVGAEGAFYSWSAAGMVADVQSWVDDPAANFGWLVKGDEARSMTAKRFDSREHPVPENRPMLVVTFTPPTECPADFNADGSVNSQDFFDFLATFFAEDPRADFNADEVVNSQDFFDFLGAFFAGC